MRDDRRREAPYDTSKKSRSRRVTGREIGLNAERADASKTNLFEDGSEAGADPWPRTSRPKRVVHPTPHRGDDLHWRFRAAAA